jgi:hypothetical protein
VVHDVDGNRSQIAGQDIVAIGDGIRFASATERTGVRLLSSSSLLLLAL